MPLFEIVLYSLASLLLLTVLLPLIKKDLWIFRIFDYPRFQKFIIIGVLAVAWIVNFYNSNKWPDHIYTFLLSFSFLHLGYLIVPFTFFGKKMIEKVKQDHNPCLNLLVANIYQYNKNYHKLLELVRQKNPDIIFLVETNHQWLEAVKILRNEYPYYIEIPKENTYGLLFYSKLPLIHYEINYLIDKEVPSIIADVKFNNQSVRIYGLHPTPPVPQENMHSTDRDAEILLVARRAKEHKGPCIVLGDLNDVAWSYTTKLFLKTSGLLDPRRGRGFFSTFHAKYFLLRWPLDHYFVSSHFRLIGMKVEKHINSDHFPISICLVIHSEDDKNKMEPDREDKKMAAEKIEAGLTDQPI
jgi:endonuclease/exonuclease/phosphatase (EEP) superfamily protein YafD